MFALERLLPLLPSALDAALSQIGGTVAYLLAGGPRAAVRANLAIVAADRPDREALVRRTFVGQVRNYLEIFRLLRMAPETLLRVVATPGWEHFERARAEGRGVIMVSGHIGPVSLCGQVFTARGIPVTLPIENETSELSRAVNRGRRALGLNVIDTESALGVGRLLKRGGTLGLLADRAVTGVGERVAFFGREALLPSAHIALALRTGARVVPAFARRERGRYVAEFQAPLELRNTGDREADVREGVRQWAAVLEERIRRAPDQWSVFEPLWER